MILSKKASNVGPSRPRQLWIENRIPKEPLSTDTLKSVNLRMDKKYTVIMGKACFVLFLVYMHCEYVCARRHVKLAVIAPSKSSMFSIQHVRPVIDYVTSRTRHMHAQHGLRFSVRFGDSKCNSADAAIKAFEFYMHHQVDVFVGPICDYSLAPVARYAPYWNIPIISPGGFAHDFGANKSEQNAEYPTLTRVGATFNSLAASIIDMLHVFHWKKVKVIYDGSGHSDVAPRFCFLAAAAFVAYSKDYKLSYGFHMFMPKFHKISDMLEEEVGAENSSKYCNVNVTICFIMFTEIMSCTYNMDRLA